jgi:hypothetical protein
MSVKFAADLRGFGNPQFMRCFSKRLVTHLLVQDSFANRDAAITNVNTGSGNKLADFGVALSAEGAHC